MSDTKAAAATRIPRTHIISWALWDWGTSAYSTLIVTFVFARYIVSDYFVPADVMAAYTAAGGDGVASGPALVAYEAAKADLTSNIGWALAIGGIIVAIAAPVIGARTDAGGKRKKWLGINTGIVIVMTAAMFFVEGKPEFFLLGAALIAGSTVFYEIANVNYNAMLLQVSTPRTMGRVSGFGWGMGYLGGIVVLLIALVGFIFGEAHWFGITADNGMNIRIIAIFAAVWSLLFSLPILLAVPENTATSGTRVGILESYRRLFAAIRGYYRDDRPTFYFLLASAVFRDGLAAVFAFGGILAGTVFGLDDTEVILFAIGGNLIAGIGVFLGGWFDDRFGSKPVIVASLIGLVITGTALFVLHDGGPLVFWVGGLLLTFFVGPAQASARTFVGHLAPVGKEGELFGLYATTGRSISFLAPTLFAVMISIGGGTHYGILGIVIVLAAGAALLIPLRAPRVR